MAYLESTVSTLPRPRPAGASATHPGAWLFLRGPHRAAVDAPPGAVLFGRDGTLIQDVSCNGDPGTVHPLAGARASLAALRAAGFALGVLSAQPGVARCVLRREQVESVQARTEMLLGPIDVWAVCPHGPHDACDCRPPAPGLVTAACHALGLPPALVTVVAHGDPLIEAALTAGAHAVRIPDGAAPPPAAPCPPCVPVVCRTADSPEQATGLLLRVRG
ncbi:HAD-IIIA family hydrolase [Kitasatospora sp. NPDC008115]|uniref:HAD-IIIA family hydrolase n=1 Tax=Kitasatospora sp. NPDC008115 TaxID=3364022 RepID=UPI0036EC1606